MNWTTRKFSQHSQRAGDHRSPFQRDKARILHSAAFRRLQAKTQVLGVGLSDFYRTRLTHSLEVSQIGQGIAAQLKKKQPALTKILELSPTLIEALCLGHDLGHPPFGHGGETALHYMMHQDGGFEGNGQTFRIVTRLEPYTEKDGMNLTRRTILGLIKYPGFIDDLHGKTNHLHPSGIRPRPAQIRASHWHPPKGLHNCDRDRFDWVMSPLSDQDRTLFTQTRDGKGGHLATCFKSFDCSIMELADDIAYGIHDLEDAIVMGLVHKDDFEEMVSEPVMDLDIYWLTEHMQGITAKLFSRHHYERKDAIGALVNAFITAIDIVDQGEDFEEPILKYNAAMPENYAQALMLFKRFVMEKVIRKPEIQLLRHKGQSLVMALFDTFSSDPERLLPENTRKRWEDAHATGNPQRIICDYIAGMTDEFASKLYNNLFMPKSGGLYDHYG